jgi:hypothetical protein
MRRSLTALAVASLAVAFTCGPSLGDPPADLLICGWTSPCIDWFPTDILMLSCPGYRHLELYPTGGIRQMWGPLTCVGPIEVSLQLCQAGVDTLPLFVEVRWGTAATECRDETGSVLWETYGALSCNPDSLWVRSPQLDLPRVVGVSNPYWLQLEGFARWDRDGHIEADSPFYNCIRVRSFPMAVAAASWGHIKTLYR